MRLIHIQKKVWSCGFHWRTFSRKPSMKEIHRIAKDELASQFDVFVRGDNIHVGFGKLPEDDKRLATALKSNSLISMLVKQENDFIGIFPLIDIYGEKFWWICCFQRGEISPLGDDICDSDDEIDSVLSQLKSATSIFDDSVHRFETPDASVSWITENLSFNYFELYRKKICRIYDKNKNIKNIALISIPIISISSIYGVYKYLEYRNSQIIKNAEIAFRLNEKKRKEEMMKNPGKYFLETWNTGPTSEQIWMYMQERIFPIQYVYNGWKIDKINISDYKIIVLWGHLNQGSYIHLPYNAKLKGSRNAETVINLKKDNSHREIKYTELPREDDVLRKFYQITQELYIHKFEPAKNGVKRSRVVKDGIELFSPWASGEWTLTGVPNQLFLDRAFPVFLDRIPGIVIKEIEFSGSEWTIKGVYHVLQ